jgi:hypothetical protein
VEKRDVRKDGTIVWIRLTRSCVRKDDGSVDYFVAVVEDISAPKHAEEQVHLLMREANHRIKNLLGLVQMIARQTAAGSPKTLSGGSPTASKCSRLTRTCWVGANNMELIWRTWYALNSRILRISLELGSQRTARNCI